MPIVDDKPFWLIYLQKSAMLKGWNHVKLPVCWWFPHYNSQVIWRTSLFHINNITTVIKVQTQARPLFNVPSQPGTTGFHDNICLNLGVRLGISGISQTGAKILFNRQWLTMGNEVPQLPHVKTSKIFQVDMIKKIIL